MAVTLVSEGYWAHFAQCVMPILCSGLDALCRADRYSVHNMHWYNVWTPSWHHQGCWISQIVQGNSCRQGFNNLILMIPCVTSGNCISCNQLLNDAGVLCHCCSYINRWSTVAGGLHDQWHLNVFLYKEIGDYYKHNFVVTYDIY